MADARNRNPASAFASPALVGQNSALRIYTEMPDKADNKDAKEKMSTGELFELLGMTLAIILLAVLGLASDFISHLLSSMDGLLLFMICLMMGGIFTLMLLMYAND